MVDIVSREIRSRMMSNIRAVSRLEDRISKSLWKLGLRFRRNVKSMIGKPDFAIKKYKVVIFIDSCFWHSCPVHQVLPKSNAEFWRSKFEENRRRDEEVTMHYNSNGWNIMRIWEHEFREDFDEAVMKIHRFVDECKRKYEREGSKKN
jgi:DNA mismatch endonuclease (patch repair protein)